MIKYNIVNMNSTHILFSIMFSDEMNSFKHSLSIYNINNKFIGVMTISLYEYEADFTEIISFINNNQHLFKTLNTKQQDKFFENAKKNNNFNYIYSLCIELTQQFFELHKVELLQYL